MGDTTWATASRLVASRAPKERQMLWGTSILAAVNAEGFSADDALLLCGLMEQTLPIYHDRASQRMVERVLEAAIGKADTMLKGVAGILLKAEKKPPGDTVCYTLLRWSCILLARVDYAAQKAAFAKLAQAQAALLGKLRGTRMWSPASGAVGRLVAAKPEAAGEYVAIVAKGASPAMVRCMLELVRSKPDALGPGGKKAFVDAYSSMVLGAKEPPPSHVASAFQPLLKMLTHEEFGETLAPSIARMLKRSPEVVMGSVAELIAGVDLDMSRYSAEILPSAVQLIKVTDETKQEAALAVVRALAKQTSDADTLRDLFDVFKGALDGKDGKLTVWQHRAGLVRAAEALCAAPGKSRPLQELAGDISSYLMEAFGKEVQEDVKVAQLQAIARWAPRAPEASLAGTVSFLGGGLKEKEKLRRAVLGCLSSVLDAGEGAAAESGGPLAARLSELAKAGFAKAAARGEGAVAASAAIRIAAVDPKAEALMEKERVWAGLLAEDSAMLSESAVSKYSVDEAVALAKGLGALQLHHVERATKAGGVVNSALTLLLMSPNYAVRKEAESTVARCLGASPTLSAGLVSAMAGWIKRWQDVPVGVSEDAGASSGPTPTQMAGALAASVDPRGLTAEVLGRVLLAAHHRRVAGGRGWARAANKMASVKGGLAAFLAAGASAACEVLAGPDGLASPHELEQRAALDALTAATRASPDAFYAAAMPRLEALADRSEHDALTEKDVLVFFTKEGRLSDDPPEDHYKGEVVDSKNVRKARGRYKMYSDSDSDDDVPLKKPEKPAARPASGRGGGRGGGAGGRGAGGGKKDARLEAREKQMAEESANRTRVRALRTRLDLALRAIARVAAGDPALSRDRLGELSAPVLPLLSSPLVGGGAAFDCMAALAKCLADGLDSLAFYVAASLRVVAIGGGAAEANVADVVSVNKVVRALAEACRHPSGGSVALEAPTFRFVYPIIRFVLRAPKHTPLHDPALAVIEPHSNPGLDVPRTDMCTTLYHALGCVPAYKDRCTRVLEQLCSGIDTSLGNSEVEAALGGVLSESAHVRAACLAAVGEVPALESGSLDPSPRVSSLLWAACYDPDAANAGAGRELWEKYGRPLDVAYAEDLLELLAHEYQAVRTMSSAAMTAAVGVHPSTLSSTLQRVFVLYGQAGWSGRSGVALTLQAMAPVLGTADVRPVTDFLISRGLADDHDLVRAQMVKAGAALIESHGADAMSELLPLCERYLDSSPGVIGVDEHTYDLVREGVVVFLGALARHLPKGDPKVFTIVGRLVAVLRTPSEAVQKAVSDCLPPLMPHFGGDREKLEPLVDDLKARLLGGETYGDRRGAAFGLAGVIKGLGISALKAYGVMDALKAAVEDKKDARSREGSLLAFECLCDKLGRLFEPYIIHILPMLLICFGDAAREVRDATEAAARAIMAQLSGQGVKLVLPALLKGLEDRQWRTKQGSVQLLGAMAHCAPRQLSTCLPTVVPRLSEVLGDTHPKVQESAQLALSEVGSVIRNPEVQTLVPTLLAAISDPNRNTRACLDVLLDTVFVNTVDAPSLALIVPVVSRGLRQPSTDAKKKAAKIVGNMCSLVNEPKDMLPYVPLLMPEIRTVLVDPIPEVRAIAAKALGSLVSGMGQESFDDLIPWLLDTMRSDTSGVERSGAAQGLAEVISVLGESHLEELLPDIIETCAAKGASVREGSLTLFRYLPACLGSSFQQYLGPVLPAILDGLADEAESVRDAALTAGRGFVELYAETSMDLLLPAVEAGLFSENWRIRQASVELLGDLLFKLAGTSGKIQTTHDGSDDEGIVSEGQANAIISVLGRDKRNDVLAALYMARSDVGLGVRTAAVHVWKTIVTNTPRTLRDILAVLMKQVIDALASEGDDRREAAGRCLGEIVRKMGDRVLVEIVPILQAGISDPSPSTRQGVCFGLSEVLESAGRHQLAAYLPQLLPTVQLGLCDESEEVREAAGAAFNTLFKGGGGDNVAGMVSALLDDMANSEGDTQALDGLIQLLRVQPQLLPKVLPRLSASPVTAINARALAAVAEVAGAALGPHMSTLVPPLLVAAAQEGGEGSDAEEEAAEAAKAALEAAGMAACDDGLHHIVAEFQKGLAHPSVGVKVAAAEAAGHFCRHSKQDYEEHYPVLMQTFVGLLAETEEEVVKTCWTALQALMSAIPKDTLPAHVRVLREAVSSAREKERRKRTGGAILVAGFCLPKALAPVLPVYLQGVLQGSSAEVREAAADGLAELVDVTSAEALKPFVVQITGPLIRIIGDRFPWQVKNAILGALLLLIKKGGIALKPFLPQLQTTFVKCLHDPSKEVRSRAASSLGLLMQMSPRVDPLVGDLISGLATTEGGVRLAMIKALRGVMEHAGKAVSGPVLSKAGAALRELLVEDDDDVRAGASAAVGFFAVYCTEGELGALLRDVAGPAGSKSWQERLANALTLAACLQRAAERVMSLEEAGVVSAIDAAAKDDKVPIRVASAKASGMVLVKLLPGGAHGDICKHAMGVVCTLMADDSTEVRHRAMRGVRHVCTKAAGGSALLPPYLKGVVPAIAGCMAGDKAPRHVVRAAERTVRQMLSGGEECLDAVNAYLASDADSKRTLTDATIKRLSRAADDDDSDGSDFD